MAPGTEQLLVGLDVGRGCHLDNGLQTQRVTPGTLDDGMEARWGRRWRETGENGAWLTGSPARMSPVTVKAIATSASGTRQYCGSGRRVVRIFALVWLAQDVVATMMGNGTAVGQRLTGR